MRLERYNHIVWSILGTGVLATVVGVGVTVGTVAIRDAIRDHAARAAASISPDSSDSPAPAADGEKDTPAAPEPGAIVPLDLNGTRIVSLVAKNDSLGGTRENWSGDDGAGDGASVVNFLMIDEATGRTRRLFPRDGYVPGWSSAHVEPLDGHGPPKSLDRMLIEFVEPDQEGDVQPDGRRGLYVCEWPAGATSPQIRRVGPERAQLVSQEVDDRTGSLLLLLRVDGNGDGQIDDSDPVKLWTASLSPGAGAGHEIAIAKVGEPAR